MRQVIIRIVRSSSQILTLAAIQWAVPILDWIETLGVDIDRTELLITVETVLFAGTVWLLTEAEERWPIISRILSWNLADNSGLDGYQPRHSRTDT